MTANAPRIRAKAPLTALAVSAVLLVGSLACSPAKETSSVDAAGVASSSTETIAAPVEPAAPPAPSPAADHDHGDMAHDHTSMDDMGMDDSGTAHTGSEHSGDGHTGGGHTGASLAPLAERQAAATPEEIAAADELWAETRAALEPYQDVDVALAAGFKPNPNELDNATIHYPHAANRRDDKQLDPNFPEGLVYYKDTDGTYTLLAAVYTVGAGEPAPSPAGPMFSWHTHEECSSFFVPVGECADTFRMLHVWITPEVTDPFNQPYSKAVGIEGRPS